MGLWDGLYGMGIGLGNDGKRVRFVISFGFPTVKVVEQ